MNFCIIQWKHGVFSSDRIFGSLRLFNARLDNTDFHQRTNKAPTIRAVCLSYEIWF